MTTTEDVRAEFASILREVADLPDGEIGDQQELRADLGVDSLALVEIVIATEERFGLRIPDEDAKQLRTVSDYVTYVERARTT